MGRASSPSLEGPVPVGNWTRFWFWFWNVVWTSFWFCWFCIIPDWIETPPISTASTVPNPADPGGNLFWSWAVGEPPKFIEDPTKVAGKILLETAPTEPKPSKLAAGLMVVDLKWGAGVTACPTEDPGPCGLTAGLVNLKNDSCSCSTFNADPRLMELESSCVWTLTSSKKFP